MAPDDADAGRTVIVGVLDDASDGDLVRAFQQGNQEAFEVLYRRHLPAVVALCRAGTGSRDDAEDLAQEVMARALNYLEGFDCSLPMWPWLKTIARNQLADHGRRGARDPWPVGPEAMQRRTDPGAEDHTEWMAERAVLDQALDELSSRDRDALRLRYIEDRSCDAVQDLLGIERPALYKVLERARNRCRDAYERVCPKLVIPPVTFVVWRVRSAFGRFRRRAARSGHAVVGSPVTAEAVAYGATAVAAVVILTSGDLPGGASPQPTRVPSASGVDLRQGGLAWSDVVVDAGRRRGGAGSDPSTAGGWIRDVASQPTATEPSRLSAGVSADRPAPADVAVNAEVQRGGTEEERTFNDRLEGRLGDDGPWSDGTTTLHCSGTTGNEAACAVYDEADRHVPDGPLGD